MSREQGLYGLLCLPDKAGWSPSLLSFLSFFSTPSLSFSFLSGQVVLQADLPCSNQRGVEKCSEPLPLRVRSLPRLRATGAPSGDGSRGLASCQDLLARQPPGLVVKRQTCPGDLGKPKLLKSHLLAIQELNHKLRSGLLSFALSEHCSDSGPGRNYICVPSWR